MAEGGGKPCGDTRLKRKSKPWEKVVLVKEEQEIEGNPGTRTGASTSVASWLPFPALGLSGFIICHNGAFRRARVDSTSLLGLTVFCRHNLAAFPNTIMKYKCTVK